MGVYFDEPKHPVIDKAPSFWKSVGNFSPQDYAIFAGVTAVSFPIGWVSGLSSKVPVPSMWTAATIGGLAGFLIAYQNSSGRLQGFKPNDAEVAAAGLGRR